MPSLNIFNIEFDRSDAVYMPGEIVSGYVIIDLAKEKLAEGLKLSAKGEASVWWTETETRSTTDINGQSTSESYTVSYSGHELYFSLTIPLLEKSEDDGKVHIPAGLSRYPFCIQLPRDIPCSFEHSVGHIRYTIKAIIVRSWRFNHECKVAFTLLSTYDLNIRREQCIGIHDEVNEAFSCCFCCISDGTINMHVKIPVTGFVPGQWIEATLDLHNNSSTELKKICLKLQQCLEFRATTKSNYERVTVVADQKTGPFNNKHVATTLRLLIPSIPPSELEFCDIIRLNYILRVALHSEMHRKVVKEYPILIGTIPLQPVPSAPPASALPQPLPGTSKMEDVIADVAPSTSSMNEFDAPPSYEECCMNRASCIKDSKDSKYVYGANDPFAPKYPVFRIRSNSR